MPRQGNGSYQQPANTAAVSGQTIGSTAFNSLVTDLGTEITNSLDRLGRSAMSAALQMGNNKVTGAADPTAAQDVATKNYVDTTTATFFSTGDVKFTIKAVADAGWVLFNDGTIGNDTSNASLASTATAAALYALLWNNISNTWCPIQDSTGALTTRGASAAADFAASKRMPLTRVCGRAMGVAGGGSGLTARAQGQIVGEENHQLVVGEMPSHTPSGTVATSVANVWTGSFTSNAAGGVGAALPTTFTTVSGSSVFTGNSIGSDTPHNNMQPTTFLNAMIKL